jgi:hypothetical protein
VRCFVDEVVNALYRNEIDFDGMVLHHEVALEGDKSNIMNVLHE